MSSKNTIALYIGLIFLAGGVAGGSIVWTTQQKQKTAPVAREFPDTKKMCDFMRKRLQDRVGLTAAQVEKIDPLLEASALEIKSIHDKTLQDVEDIIRKTHSEIAATLTPDQKVRLDEVENERRKFWRKHFKKREQKEKEKLEQGDL